MAWNTDGYNAYGPLSVFDTSAKDAQRKKIFDDLRAQAEQAYSPNNINPLFNTMMGNMSRMSGGAVAGAQRAAGANAYAGGALNPMSAVLNAGQNARAPYVQAQGQVEQARVGALQDAVAKKLQFNTALQGQEFNQNLSLEQLQLQKDQIAAQLKQYADSQPDTWDYILKLAPAAAAILFPPAAPYVAGATAVQSATSNSPKSHGLSLKQDANGTYYWG